VRIRLTRSYPDCCSSCPYQTGKYFQGQGKGERGCVLCSYEFDLHVLIQAAEKGKGAEVDAGPTTSSSLVPPPVSVAPPVPSRDQDDDVDMVKPFIN